jgi:hypothetical protein
LQRSGLLCTPNQGGKWIGDWLLRKVCIAVNAATTFFQLTFACKAHFLASVGHLAPERSSADALSRFPASAPPTSQVFDHRKSQSEDPQSINLFTPSNQSTEPDSLLPSYSQPHEPVKRTDLSKTPIPGSHAMHNPFLNLHRQEKLPVTAVEHLAPPEPPKLPPRKSSLVPPPVHPILQYRRRSVSPAQRSTPSRHSPLPQRSAKARFTSTPVQENSQVKKASHTTKKHENGQEQERGRVLQVLKGSAVISGGYSLTRAHVDGSSVVVGTSIHNRTNGRSRSASPSKLRSEPEVEVGRAPSPRSGEQDRRVPPLPRRQPTQQQQSSPPGSVSASECIVPGSPVNPSLHQLSSGPFSPSFPFPPPSPSFSHSQPPLSPYHKSRPLPIPVTSGKSVSSYNPPRASPTRPALDLPLNRFQRHGDRNTHPAINLKPSHFLHRNPSLSSVSSSNTTPHVGPEPEQDDPRSPVAASSSPPPTPAKLAFPSPLPALPTPSRAIFHNVNVSGPRPITPSKPLPQPLPLSPSLSHNRSESGPITPAKPASASPHISLDTPGFTPHTPQRAKKELENNSSSTPRIFRSNSLHQLSPPLPPLPPTSTPSPTRTAVRRKRPETVLVLSSGEIIFGGNARGSIPGGDAVPNQDKDLGKNRDHVQGTEDQESKPTLSRHSSSPGAGHHSRSSLSRSVSVSSSSTAQTTVSQPAPHSHSRSESQFLAHRHQHTHHNQGRHPIAHPENAPPPSSSLTLTNIQRTIAKFDALHPRPVSVHPRYGTKVEVGMVPSGRAGRGES